MVDSKRAAGTSHPKCTNTGQVGKWDATKHESLQLPVGCLLSQLGIRSTPSLSVSALEGSPSESCSAEGWQTAWRKRASLAAGSLMQESNLAGSGQQSIIPSAWRLGAALLPNAGWSHWIMSRRRDQHFQIEFGHEEVAWWQVSSSGPCSVAVWQMGKVAGTHLSSW